MSESFSAKKEWRAPWSSSLATQVTDILNWDLVFLHFLYVILSHSITCCEYSEENRKVSSILYRISVLRDNFGKAKPEKKHDIKVNAPVRASCLAFRSPSTAFQGIMQSPFTFLLEESLCRLLQLVSRVKLSWVGEGFFAFLECVNAHT